MQHAWEELIFYYHPIFLEHLKGVRHPECPERLKVITGHLQAGGLWERLKVLEPPKADLRWIETNHSEDYVQSLQDAIHHAPAVLDGGDTIVTALSMEAALYAAGACMAGVDDLVADRAKTVFCAVRPPGHHAEFDEAMGFCLINNVAVAARYAIQQHSLQRIFILDWDVHHGNGTHHSFYDISEVYFSSIHEWPLYPGTGAEHQRGRGVGHGYTLNVPFPADHGDDEYLAAIRDKVIPEMKLYHPDLLILSAGFDAHAEDPLAHMNVSTEGYREMTRMLRAAMQSINGGKILSVLEGGYHQHNLAESVQAHLEALVETSE